MAQVTWIIRKGGKPGEDFMDTKRTIRVDTTKETKYGEDLRLTSSEQEAYIPYSMWELLTFAA